MTVKTADRYTVAVQTGRLTYRTPAGELNETSELYLLAFVNDRPLIIDRMDGHTPTLEMQDLDSDGRRELLLYYHAGANRLLLRLYRINGAGVTSEHLSPVQGDQLSSNMGSIKIIRGKIEILEQQRISADSAVNSTETYELDGLTLKRVGTLHEIVTR